MVSYVTGGGRRGRQQRALAEHQSDGMECGDSHYVLFALSEQKQVASSSARADNDMAGQPAKARWRFPNEGPWMGESGAAAATLARFLHRATGAAAASRLCAPQASMLLRSVSLRESPGITTVQAFEGAGRHWSIAILACDRLGAARVQVEAMMPSRFPACVCARRPAPLQVARLFWLAAGF
jgi:hypothetical protein